MYPVPIDPSSHPENKRGRNVKLDIFDRGIN